jgi:hypothetical protein
VNIHGGTKGKAQRRKTLLAAAHGGRRHVCQADGRTDKNITDNTNGLDAPAIPQHLLLFSPLHLRTNFHNFFFFFFLRFSTLAQLFWLFVWEKKGDVKNLGK